jgi:hypothetical protein
MIMVALEIAAIAIVRRRAAIAHAIIASGAAEVIAADPTIVAGRAIALTAGAVVGP